MNVAEFDLIAKKVFAPIYPYVAGQIVNRTGIIEGRSLDIGTGGGYLGLEVAKASNLSVTLLDNLKEQIEICNTNIKQESLEEKVVAILGDVHELPFEDESFDLIISRGSVFFWEDLGKAFKEIYRVLKSCGKTYIGGGFGNIKIKNSIPAKMEEIGLECREGMFKRNSRDFLEPLKNGLSDAGIINYNILLSEEEGIWVIIQK